MIILVNINIIILIEIDVIILDNSVIIILISRDWCNNIKKILI